MLFFMRQVLKPPKSKEEKELEQEAVQQRLLEEANSKRNAAIQQLRATFQSAPGTCLHTRCWYFELGLVFFCFIAPPPALHLPG